MYTIKSITESIGKIIYSYKKMESAFRLQITITTTVTLWLYKVAFNCILYNSTTKSNDKIK